MLRGWIFLARSSPFVISVIILACHLGVAQRCTSGHSIAAAPEISSDGGSDTIGLAGFFRKLCLEQHESAMGRKRFRISP
jgi:hypothetical protein